MRTSGRGPAHGLFLRGVDFFYHFFLCGLQLGMKARAWEPAEKKLWLPLESREAAQLNVALAHELQGQGGRDRVWGQLSS